MPGPGLGAAIRNSLTDYYFHSVRLVPVNLVWGAVAVAIALLALSWPIGGLIALPLLATPAGAAFAMSAAIVRGGATMGIRDALVRGRVHAGRSVAIGTGWVLANVVLATNVVTGLAGVSIWSWLIATSAAWGIAILWCAAVVAWPLLFDPAHPDRSIRDTMRLAAALLLFAPVRFGALGAVTAIVVVVSTILTAALLTISVSFVALLACRAVYPLADRLEPQLARRMG